MHYTQNDKIRQATEGTIVVGVVGDFRSREDKGTFADKDYKRSNEINQKYDTINQKIRDYLHY